MTNVAAVTVFADDSRDETSGKMTVVGVYGADIHIESPSPSPFTVVALTRVIGPTDTEIKYIVIDYLLDGKSFHKLTIPNERLEPYREAHDEEMAMFASLAREGNRVVDATLVHGALTLIVPPPRALSLLSVTVDIGYGPMHTGDRKSVV